ncbi:uncharacterized protein N7529_001030 [Penicillium soppii]|uniref:uncharacterized protein n=1 Tax=Penicillium soppii TaxID=69789 RepID=UPI002546B1AE|nr:uncharacterized protein N7529_001030 [Penicillium soppii]KAJ5882358.1 hypothetical protein N7529_001030 [Penicillium soppii]
MLILFTRYTVRYFRELIRSYFTSTIHISYYDEAYDMLYKGHLLILHCAIKDHREDIYISSISLYPNILKELVKECRRTYLNNINKKITIFKHREGD